MTIQKMLKTWARRKTRILFKIFINQSDNLMNLHATEKTEITAIHECVENIRREFHCLLVYKYIIPRGHTYFQRETYIWDLYFPNHP
jgi:hypothetical protein